jgi:hypothetical protein
MPCKPLVNALQILAQHRLKKDFDMMNRNGRQDYIFSARERMIMLPASIRFSGANFEHAQDDLVITDKDGDRVYVRGFFSQVTYPLLACDDGELMSGDLAVAFVNLSSCAQDVPELW